MTGYTGKGWSPGRLELRPNGQPCWTRACRHKLRQSKLGTSNKDYASNFADFMEQCPEDAPFCFLLGTYAPHRGCKSGAGLAAGKDPTQVVVPPCLPDHPIVTESLSKRHSLVPWHWSRANRWSERIEYPVCRNLMHNPSTTIIPNLWFQCA